MNNFLFVAAENDGIAKCKAGGMGDVVRDVPRQISERGDKAHIIVPSYSRLHQNGTLKTLLNFKLRGVVYTAELYEVIPKKEFANVHHYVIHHPEIEAGGIAQRNRFIPISLNMLFFVQLLQRPLRRNVLASWM